MLPHLTAAVMLLLSSAKGAPPAQLDGSAVLAELDKLALKDLWPGFDPREVPLALYDGKRTLLVHHPGQPKGFSPVREIAGALAYPGRHEVIRANTATELDGALTATVTLDSRAGLTVQKAAALAIHEAFHVFQRARHAAWGADEAALFTYPFEDEVALARRRVETRALARALAAKDAPSILCWASEAVETRRERFSQMPPEAVAYERGNELNEGLAHYVEGRALESWDKAIPEADFPAEAIRERVYASGRTLALLLDRTNEGWREELDKSRESLSLDEMLRQALVPLKAKRCAVSTSDREAIRKAAARDIEALRRRKAKERADFTRRSGWKLVVETEEEPFTAERFDPLNVEVLGKGEVLHRRWIKLDSALGGLEVLGQVALTEAAGAHPLMQGVRRVTVTGLRAKPVLKKTYEGTLLTAEGVKGLFKTAKVSTARKEVRVVAHRPR